MGEGNQDDWKGEKRAGISSEAHTKASPEVESEEALTLQPSVLPDVRDDGRLPYIALDGLDPVNELLDQVKTAVSSGSNGETSTEDGGAER